MGKGKITISESQPPAQPSGMLYRDGDRIFYINRDGDRRDVTNAVILQSALDDLLVAAQNVAAALKAYEPDHPALDVLDMAIRRAM